MQHVPKHKSSHHLLNRHDLTDFIGFPDQKFPLLIFTGDQLRNLHPHVQCGIPESNARGISGRAKGVQRTGGDHAADSRFDGGVYLISCMPSLSSVHPLLSAGLQTWLVRLPPVEEDGGVRTSPSLRRSFFSKHLVLQKVPGVGIVSHPTSRALSPSLSR